MENPIETAKNHGCKHERFIGYPMGYTPMSWRCECGLQLTAGEMFLYGQLIAIKNHLRIQNEEEIPW